jgi:hypothetical protein
MSLLRLLLILLILLFFGALVAKLLSRRIHILNENFEVFATKDGEMKQFTINEELPTNTVGVITNFSSRNNLKLKEYCVMTSQNTAKTGSYMNTEMIKYVLSRGCRFMDFEIYEFDGAPYVAHSSDTNNRYIDTKNKILLDDALRTVANFGFAAPSPNPNDPIFVHLRIRINKITDKMNKIIATIINDNLGQRLMSGAVSGNTPFFSLKEKVVLIIDREHQTPIIPHNIVSDSNQLTVEYFDNILTRPPKPVIINSDNLNTNITNLFMGITDGDNPIQLDKLIKEHAVQFICHNFYKNTTEYERYFNENGSAFVPFSQMIPYIKKKI